MSVMADRAVRLLDYLKIDPASDDLLEQLVRALLDPADRLSLIAHGDGTIGPWSAITDPAVAPIWALPTASQWTGGILPARRAGETDPDYLERARIELLSPSGMRRGSAPALQTIARQHLEGTRTVRIAERLVDPAFEWTTVLELDDAYTGRTILDLEADLSTVLDVDAPHTDAWQVGVLVIEDEVIDLDELIAAVNADDVITGGVRAVVDFLPPDLAWTIVELEGTYYGRTILDLEGDFATVLDLDSGIPA